jgi:hypothetical protein
MVNLIAKKFFALLFLTCNLLLFTCNLTAQQPTQEWVARWPSPSPVSATGRQIKTDALGYIYVLADTGNGFGFLKYDASGNLLFSTTYWPGGYPSGWGLYFGVTALGDVYVTGSMNLQFDSWIYTAKFNSNGVLQWGKLYNPDNDDFVNDLIVDNVGNIVIAAGARIGSTAYALLIKYNGNGDTLWTRYFNNGQTEASYNKIVIDSLNDIFLTGFITHVGKCLISKYVPSGNMVWFQTFTLEQGRTNLGVGISRDIKGNLYVIGTQARLGPYETYLLKLNSSGDTLWSRKFPGYATGNNSPWGPVIGSNGNAIYYASSFEDSVGTGVSFSTFKYDSAGTLGWIKLFNGGFLNTANIPADIKLDKTGNIYVCGTAYFQTTGNDYVTLKYLPTGSLQWVANYIGIVTNGGDYAYGLVVDTSLNVYVTGSSRKAVNSNPDAVTIKYNQPVAIVNNNNSLPETCALQQNYPNPFNSVTVINYQLPKTGSVLMILYDVLGKEMKILTKAYQNAGYFSMALNMDNFPSGIYFYRLIFDNSIEQVRKLILVK